MNIIYKYACLYIYMSILRKNLSRRGVQHAKLKNIHHRHGNGNGNGNGHRKREIKSKLDRFEISCLAIIKKARKYEYTSYIR